ncbi:MAG: TonB-dependent receptor [Gammaproteobacteria bacterium]
MDRVHLDEFVRVNNLFDRKYVGAVIIADFNHRYFEPAPGRNFMVGVTASYRF